MMKETLDAEISSLFEELVVSKIKLSIGEIDKKVVNIESNSMEILEIIEKLPKQSNIKKTFQDTADGITNYVDSYVVKYLGDIDGFLREQYGFSDKKVLSNYLEDLSEMFATRINNVINLQENLEDEVKKVDSFLTQFKAELINTIIERQKELKGDVEHIIEQNEDIGKKHSKTLAVASEERKKNSEKLESISLKLTTINRIIGGTSNEGEEECSLREFISEIANEIVSIREEHQTLIEKIEAQSKLIFEKNTLLDMKLKILIILSSLSTIGIIGLTILKGLM